MTRALILSAFESFNPAPFAGMQLLADAGIDGVRYWLCGHQVLRDKCVHCGKSLTGHDAEQAGLSTWSGALFMRHEFSCNYDWSRTDNDMAAMSDAGLDICVDLMWLPPWMSAGQPAYMPYTDGCAVYNDPRDGSKGWRYADLCGWYNSYTGSTCLQPRESAVHATRVAVGVSEHYFTPEKPYCINPAIPHVDSAALGAFAVAFAERYGLPSSPHYTPHWRWTSCWNEPGGPWYWPPIQSPPYEAGYDRLIGEVVIPWADGIASVLHPMRFVGIEADSPGTVSFWLGAAERAGRPMLCCITGEHIYGSVIEAKLRIKDYESVLARHPARERWLSETGLVFDWANGDPMWDCYSAIVLYPQGEGWFRAGTWDAGAPEPNADYQRIKETIAEYKRRRQIAERKRRAVKSEG